MYASPFEYHAPSTLAEALQLLDKHKDEAKVLTGGQSLVPLMKLRLAAPSTIIDLRKVPGLTGVMEDGATLRIGALTTHGAIAADATVKKKLPMVAEAALLIGDTQVRNAGTIGGSLAHADPSADWPAVMTALDASIVVAGSSGIAAAKAVKIADFITGPLSTVLGPGDIVTTIVVPMPPARTAGAYEKLPHPASRFAIVGVAAEVSLAADGTVAWSRIGITGLASKVYRATGVEQALQGKKAAEVAKTAAARAAEGIELRDDPTGSAAYRSHLAAVYTERAVLRAAERAAKR
ncbi:MAG TPA: xanthine dehydrogenase family protein subunit M [Myxococcales bacterium]|jgi:carbon-monoxide dehydrogenase medium subunit